MEGYYKPSFSLIFHVTTPCESEPSTFAKHSMLLSQYLDRPRGRSHSDKNECSKLFLYVHESCRVLCDSLVAEVAGTQDSNQENVADQQQRYAPRVRDNLGMAFVSSGASIGKLRSSRRQARVDYTRTRTRSAVANEALERSNQCLVTAVSQESKDGSKLSIAITSWTHDQ